MHWELRWPWSTTQLVVEERGYWFYKKDHSCCIATELMANYCSIMAWVLPGMTCKNLLMCNNMIELWSCQLGLYSSVIIILTVIMPGNLKVVLPVYIGLYMLVTSSPGPNNNQGTRRVYSVGCIDEDSYDFNFYIPPTGNISLCCSSILMWRRRPGIDQLPPPSSPPTHKRSRRFEAAHALWLHVQASPTHLFVGGAGLQTSERWR